MCNTCGDPACYAAEKQVIRSGSCDCGRTDRDICMVRSIFPGIHLDVFADVSCFHSGSFADSPTQMESAGDTFYGSGNGNVLCGFSYDRDDDVDGSAIIGVVAPV